ncbi:MAG: dehydrogenase, partial [Opitutae bacterium]|nr:dehydrogenase [Opitutae bacterium]
SRAIIRYEFIEKGAGYTASVLPPLISSRHPNFRPVDCKIGPDGALYVADWYNPIINHAKHNFRDPRRDKDHGRVWRITAKDRPLVKKPQLVDATIPALVDQLKSPEQWTRHQARNVLAERDPDAVAKELATWVTKLDPKDPDHDHHLVEAMWACQNVERPSEDILKRVLSAKDGHARSAGARVLRYWHEDLADPVALLAKAAADPFPRTRMEAILSAGYVPKAEAFSAALVALDHPRDVAIDLALPQTVTALERYWRPALETNELKFKKDSHRDFAEREAGIGFEKRLGTYLKKKSPGLDETRAIIDRLVSDANVKQARMTVDAVARKKPDADPRVMVVMLEGLAKIGRKGDFSLDQRINPLKRLLNHPNDAVAAAAATNLGAWQLKGADPDLLKILGDSKRATSVRRAASISLGQLRSSDASDTLRKLAFEGEPADRYFAIFGLAEDNAADAAKAAAELLVLDPGKSDPVALVQAFTRRNKGADFLIDALENKKPHADALNRLSDYHRRTGQLPRRLAQIFQAPVPRSLAALLIKENRKALTAAVDTEGDPVRGETIFRRKALACFSCHAIGPVGSRIGPNLVAVGAAAQTDYMIEAILEPNKAIAQHYENKLIQLADGTIHMGAITYKSEKEVVIRDSAQGGKEVKLPMTDVRKIRPMPSLMPAGLADQLNTRQEFLDLTKFISLLGRPGPYANDESPVIRKWKIAPGSADKPPASDAPWLTVYSKVEGVLPDAELGPGEIIYAQGAVDVQVAGPVKLLLNSPKGLKLWIDDRPVNNLAAPLDLTAGKHVLTFAIQRSQRGPTGLRAELTTPTGSPAKFTPEGGL